MLDKFIRPWNEATDDELRDIEVICFDIDDTFSTEGKITAEAYSALWALHHAGFGLVPVTGRAAGWCDHIVRFWPVDVVVGENGAFVYYFSGGKLRREETLSTSADLKKKLLNLKSKIEKEFSDVVFASDQSFRDYDLAIDICEDVPTWPSKEVDRLINFCEKEGANVKLSSIHVNTWYGDFDKSKGISKWFDDGALGLKEKPKSWEQFIFLGDSPNDEPLFDLFNKSVGVANLTKYLPQIKKQPSWITSAESGTGFVEIARRFLDLKV